jgi:hypothetical protein
LIVIILPSRSLNNSSSLQIYLSYPEERFILHCKIRGGRALWYMPVAFTPKLLRFSKLHESTIFCTTPCRSRALLPRVTQEVSQIFLHETMYPSSNLITWETKSRDMVPSGYERKRTPLQHSSNASTILSQLMKNKKIQIKNLCYGDVEAHLLCLIGCDVTMIHSSRLGKLHRKQKESKTRN